MTALAGSTVVITGGASGIGLGLARSAASAGARVVIWDRDPGQLGQAVSELKEAGRQRPLGQVVDVTDRDAVGTAAADARQEVGPIDILVNSAGVVSGKPLPDLSEADVRRTFEVNTLALFWVTQAFLDDMLLRDRGHVVTIASASGLIGVSRLTDYSASKWAAIGFDESLRVELRQSGSKVSTTVVCPYYIDTGMFDGVKTRVPWLLPILDPDDVVAKVWKAVRRDKRRLHLPPIVGTLPVMRGLPVGLFDRAANLLGVNRSMDEFRGRRETSNRP